MDEVKVVAIDPGDVHVGYVLACGDEVTYGKCSPADLLVKLLAFKPDVIVLERFMLDLNRSEPQSGSEMDTSRLIGRIELLAEQNDWDIVRQQPSVRGSTESTPYWKVFCQAHSRPKNRHARDAALHYVHWRHLNSRGPKVRLRQRPVL